MAMMSNSCLWLQLALTQTVYETPGEEFRFWLASSNFHDFDIYSVLKQNDIFNIKHYVLCIRTKSRLTLI